MKPERFSAWVAGQNEQYAAEKVKSGAWPAEGALERAKAEFASLLPSGIDTPRNHILDIFAVTGSPQSHHPSEERIGTVWLAQAPFGKAPNHGWIFDVEIDVAFRGRGFGRATMTALEDYARAQGITEIGLHVFGQNPGAQALYAGLGYGVTGISMLKRLAPAAWTCRVRLSDWSPS